MSISFLTVHFPFRFSKYDKVEIPVSNTTVISDIVKEAIEFQGDDFISDPDFYGIYVKPIGEWLFPSMSVGEYSSFLSKPDPMPTIELRYKYPREIRIDFLEFQVSLLCDPMQKITMIIGECIKNLNGKHNATKNWNRDRRTLLFNGNIVDQELTVSTLFQGSNDIPELLLRREISSTENDAKNTIFGGNIITALEKENDGKDVPFFFSKCIELISLNRDYVGIYRKSGDYKTIENIINKIETTTDQDELSDYLEAQKIHDLACVVKNYIRNIREPIIPSFLANDFKTVLKPNIIETLKSLKVLVNSLPTAHFNLLKMLSEHLYFVSQSEKNQMPLKNLAICIGPNLTRMDTKGPGVLAETTAIQTVAQMIFEHWRYMFLNEPCNLKTNRAVLIRSIEFDEITLEKGTDVYISKKDNNNEWSFDYNGSTYSAPSDVFQLFPPIEVHNFTKWTLIKSDTFSILKYLIPDDSNTIKSQNTKQIIQDKIMKLKSIEKEIYSLIDSFVEDPSEEERKKLYNDLITKFGKI